MSKGAGSDCAARRNKKPRPDRMMTGAKLGKCELGLTNSHVISKYCSCYMNILADTITYGDRNAIAKDGIGVLQKEVGAANASCI
jgi:hypothetical protein